MTKRGKPVAGYIKRADGTRIAVRDERVAQALDAARDEVRSLEDAMRSARMLLNEAKEREAAHALLRRHWWVRLGTALRIIRL